MINAYHRFSEYGIIHQFEKIFFKLVGCRFPLFGVEVDIGLQPTTLRKRYNSMYFCYYHPESDV
jgi:hypothetical protein